jgi:hypothetical protein
LLCFISKLLMRFLPLQFLCLTAYTDKACIMISAHSPAAPTALFPLVLYLHSKIRRLA